MQTLTNLTQMCSSMQSVPIITNVVSSNPAHGYNIMCFSTTKTDHYDMTEILLKVALNTITPPPPPPFYDYQNDFWR